MKLATMIPRSKKFVPSFEVRVQMINETPGQKLDYPAKIASYWRRTIRKMAWHFEDREVFVVIFVNTRLHAIGHTLVSIGTLNETTYHAREVFRSAIVANAYGIVLAHNHPSGDPNPSMADRSCTARMQRAGRLLGIQMLDHVIIGRRKIYSFKGEGFIRSRTA